MLSKINPGFLIGLVLLTSYACTGFIMLQDAGGFTTVANAGSFSPDGTDEQHEEADFLSGGSAFTDCMLIKDSAGGGALVQVAGQWSTVSDAVKSFSWWGVSAASNKISGLIHSGSSSKYYTTSVDVFTGSWKFICQTFSSNTYKFYVDGVEDTSVTKTTDETVNSIQNVTVDVVAGSASNDSFYSSHLQDEWAHWSVALSAAEITEIYGAINGGSNLFPDLTTTFEDYTSSANLQFWYRYESDSHHSNANGVLDASGGGNHATGVNLEAGDMNDGDVI